MSENDLLIGGGQYMLEGEESSEPRFVFSLFQPEAEKPTLIETGFLPHAVALYPQEPTRLAIFEKKGPGACLIDLNEMKVIRPLHTVAGRHFYGHGVYSKDGSLLYSTEAYLDGFRGVIAVRDADSLELLGEFPSYGEEPHECQFIDDGRVMVVTNGGGPIGGSPPCITYIDVASQKLLDRMEPTNVHINTGHFSIGEGGELIVVSAPRAGLETTHNGGVSIRNADGVLQSMDRPVEIVGRMKGEALSVAIHEPSDVAAVTHPDGDMVTFWSMKEGRFLKALDLSRPRGVALDREGKAFYISYASETELARVDTETLEVEEGSQRGPTYLSGSHILNWMREIEALGFAI